MHKNMAYWSHQYCCPFYGRLAFEEFVRTAVRSERFTSVTDSGLSSLRSSLTPLIRKLSEQLHAALDCDYLNASQDIGQRKREKKVGKKRKIQNFLRKHLMHPTVFVRQVIAPVFPPHITKHDIKKNSK